MILRRDEFPRRELILYLRRRAHLGSTEQTTECQIWWLLETSANSLIPSALGEAQKLPSLNPNWAMIRLPSEETIGCRQSLAFLSQVACVVSIPSTWAKQMKMSLSRTTLRLTSIKTKFKEYQEVRRHFWMTRISAKLMSRAMLDLQST